jgi:hypothetical protein
MNVVESAAAVLGKSRLKTTGIGGGTAPRSVISVKLDTDASATTAIQLT